MKTPVANPFPETRLFYLDRGKMRTPVVDWNTCIGCGSRVARPGVFELWDDKAWGIGPDKCGTCNCPDVMDICPVQAISPIEE